MQWKKVTNNSSQQTYLHLGPKIFHILLIFFIRKVQNSTKRYTEVCKGTQRYIKVHKGTKRNKKVQKGTTRYKKVQQGTQMY